MLLETSTWTAIEAYLRRSTGIIVPIGSIEQHGPNGLMATDALCAETVAAAAGEIADALVGPTIRFGVAPFNLQFPGTISIRATTLIALVEDYVGSLALQGFDHFYFVNGHGANSGAVRAAFHDVYAARVARGGGGDGMRLRLRSWWELPAVDRLRRQLYADREGLHATPSEIAITMAARPGAVTPMAMAPLAPLTAAFLHDHGGDAHFDAADHRRRFPDGRVGSDPTLATAADGEQLIRLAAAAAAADYQAFLAE
ncbi:MAG: creatininase family protein [Proteobacteria bacterium]|nr:creatininase family protein [Pseudomonadota bacterium]